MLNLYKIPDDIIADLKNRGHDGSAIQQMTPQQAFAEYCRWNGLSDWGNTLWNAMKDLQAATA